MKKPLILVITMISIVCQLYAQKTIRYGITGDVDYVLIKNLCLSTEGVAGFKIGGMADIPLNQKFSFQPSLVYATKGGKGTTSVPFASYDIKSKLSVSSNYIEMPLPFAFKYPSGSGSTFVINAGPYIAYGISGKTKINSIDATLIEPWDTKWNTFNANKSEEPISVSMNKFDCGITTGIGFEVNKFLIMLRTEIGLTDVYSNDGIPEGKAGTERNFSFGLNLGYYFN